MHIAGGRIALPQGYPIDADEFGNLLEPQVDTLIHPVCGNLYKVRRKVDQK
ncbi:MAG: hypothetical protein WDM77_13200 [Steroidobacteraceae bacterium]